MTDTTTLGPGPPARAQHASAAGGLKLRHHHGSQSVADDYRREIAFFGIESSPAFVREPEGNGCVECFIRTLKENLLWVRRFDTRCWSSSGSTTRADRPAPRLSHACPGPRRAARRPGRGRVAVSAVSQICGPLHSLLTFQLLDGGQRKGSDWFGGGTAAAERGQLLIRMGIASSHAPRR